MLRKTHVVLTTLIIAGVSLGTTIVKASANNSITPLKTNNNANTQIRMITPFSVDGLNPKLKITKSVDGMCWTSSEVDKARPNTWRCHSKDTVYDPCFNNHTREENTVICLQSPWDKNVVKLKLSNPLPSVKVDKFSSKIAQPWALELSKGRLCTMITGPSSTIAGMPITYQCKSGAIIVGDIDRTPKKWLVFYLGNEELFMHQTEVLSAWF